jgi:TPR repeat protein
MRVARGTVLAAASVLLFAQVAAAGELSKAQSALAALRADLQGGRIARAEILYFARGSILVARQYFELAADAGLAGAALRLAATYDPAELQRLEVPGVVPDRDLARKWYERARELGAREAEAPLAWLSGK